MSLSGQWIGLYEGTNSGTMVIELDEVGDHYEGTACAWDNDPRKPSAMAEIRTTSKASIQRFEVNVRAISSIGDEVSPAQLERLLVESGLTFPKTAEIEVELRNDEIMAKWVTPVSTSGAGLARGFGSSNGASAKLKASKIKTWESFKNYTNQLERGRYVYRGQEDSDWRLRTSFHREGRSSLQRYSFTDVSELQKVLSGIIQHPFNINDPFQHVALLNTAQHHGYPTPLLDWTRSPYIAAFFAYRTITSNQSGKKVRIYKLDTREWNKLPRPQKIFPSWPGLAMLDPLTIGNIRAVPQQSVSMFSNVHDIETHIQRVETAHKTSYIEVFDLPVKSRDYVMSELALMGITAGSLFPGLDGACEALKEQNFRHQR